MTKYQKGDVVHANGFPAVVISPTRGMVTMVSVFGYGHDMGDTYNTSISPCDENIARNEAKSYGYFDKFNATLVKYRTEKLRDDARKAKAAAKKNKEIV